MPRRAAQAGANEITFRAGVNPPPNDASFPYTDVVRVYLLRDRAGLISVVVNARASIQTFDGIESVEADRHLMDAVRSHGAATEESVLAPEVAEPQDARTPAGPVSMPVDQLNGVASLGAPPRNPTWNPVAGIAGGIGVAIAGAALWAGIADATHYRLSLIGVVIGLAVAFVFKRFGLRGPVFAVVAAVLAICGCALGDIGAGTLIVAAQAGVGAGDVLKTIPIT